MPFHDKETRKYRGPIKDRQIDDMDEVDQAAFMLEARSAADYIERRYGNNPDFMAVVGRLVSDRGIEKAQAQREAQKAKTDGKLP